MSWNVYLFNQQRLIFKNATKILNIRKVLNLTIGQRKQKEIWKLFVSKLLRSAPSWRTRLWSGPGCCCCWWGSTSSSASEVRAESPDSFHACCSGSKALVSSNRPLYYYLSLSKLSKANFNMRKLFNENPKTHQSSPVFRLIQKFFRLLTPWLKV